MLQSDPVFPCVGPCKCLLIILMTRKLQRLWGNTSKTKGPFFSGLSLYDRSGKAAPKSLFVQNQTLIWCF